MDVKVAVLLIVLMMLATGCVGTATRNDSNSMREITVKLSNFKITPSTIEVNQGDSVKLIVEIAEGTHNLYIDGYDLRTEAALAKDTQIIEFNADSAGEFATWCEVRDHRARGMEGRLVVK
jgi:plastocyanin